MEPKSLPPVKISPNKLLPSSSASSIVKKISTNSLVDSANTVSKPELGIVKKQVIQVKDLIATNTLLKKAEETRQRKVDEQKRFKEKEEKLEKPKETGSDKVKLPATPKLSFLDRIKRFLFNILLGFVVVRLIPHLPKLIGIVKLAGQALDLVVDWGGKLLNGLVSFIDWGYKAYEGTKKFLGNLGGENFTKVFDTFSGIVGKVIETTIAAAIIIGTQRESIDVEKTKGIDSKQKPKPGRRPKVTSSGEPRSIFGRKPTITVGKGGAKTALRTIRPLLKRLPIIGALIDFGLSVAMGEDPGRAAFKAIGAGLLGSVGAAVGSVVPIAGNLIGGIVGGIAGDAIGGALYDMFFGGKKPSPKGKVQGKAGGGITRGGKSQSGVRRSVGSTKKGKYKRVLARKPSKTEFKTKDKKVKEVSENLDRTNYFGPILAVSSKIMENEKPTQKDYENVGLGLNLLVAKGVEDGQLKGGLVAAFAGGGVVDEEFLSAAEKGTNISNWVSETFRDLIESKVEKNLRLIKEKAKAKPAGVPGPGEPGSPDMINIQGGDADFWTLVAIASREDGDPQAWADVAQSIYNRLASGAYTGKTIKDLVLGQMQYEPTWKFPKPGAVGKPNPEWYAIKDAASAGLAAGQSEGAMKKVAAAILNPTLQKNAREFIQGRTDFRGYSVSGGVQRKSGDNYFGWYNNYRANKIGSVPNFGATATTTGGTGPDGSFVGGGTGSGHGSGGVKIAGDLGDYLKANRGSIGITGSIHQHPRHPGQFRRSYPSYHNQNRALDIGGYGPNHPSSGGRDEQASVIRALLAWNKKNGYTPVQIIHGSPAFKGLGKYESAPNALHSNHVHVAYGRGGLVRGMTKALLGERGIEFVLDTDTTTALERNFPGFLSELNKANYDGAIQVLRNYASYEVGAPLEVVVDQPEPEIITVPLPIPQQGIISQSKGSGSDSSYDHSYKNG